MLKGSRILVTTRKDRVASMVGSTNPHMIKLEGLSEPHCLSIFKHMAFRNREADADGVFGDMST